jgi:hypothetical protein
MPGKLARPVWRGAVRKRTRELREPRRTAYPTIAGIRQARIFMPSDVYTTLPKPWCAVFLLDALIAA